MSAKAVDSYGMFLRADHMLYRTITDRNISIALYYAKKALKKCIMNERINLPTCYFHGLSVDQNEAKAIQLWTECIEAGGYA